MKTPHKHAELIKAWADGAEIEYRSVQRDAWVEVSCPGWYPAYEYRIKPKNQVRYGILDPYNSDRIWVSNTSPGPRDSIKVTLNPEGTAIVAVEMLNKGESHE